MMKKRIEELAYKLNKIIEEEYTKHKDCICLGSKDKLTGSVFSIEFRNNPNTKETDVIRYIKNDYGNTNIKYSTTITLKEICQIVGFVLFCNHTQIYKEKVICKIINCNPNYDFSVIKTILENHVSFKMIELYEYISVIDKLYNKYRMIKSNSKETSLL